MNASVPLVTEYLFHFPESDTPHGCVPAFYAVERSPEACRAAAAAGGVDVSEDPAAWRAYERGVRSHDASLL